MRCICSSLSFWNKSFKKLGRHCVICLDRSRASDSVKQECRLFHRASSVTQTTWVPVSQTACNGQKKKLSKVFPKTFNQLNYTFKPFYCLTQTRRNFWLILCPNTRGLSGGALIHVADQLFRFFLIKKHMGTHCHTNNTWSDSGINAHTCLRA